MGCLEGNCEYSTGNFRARKRVQYVKKLLGKLSIEKKDWRSIIFQPLKPTGFAR